MNKYLKSKTIQELYEHLIAVETLDAAMAATTKEVQQLKNKLEK